MRIVITGASGFIGRALSAHLAGNYEIVALSRNAENAAKVLGTSAKVIEWDPGRGGQWRGEIENALAVVNLAGENVGSGRWTRAKKTRIMQSRIDCTNALLDAVKSADNKPAVMIQGSAIGYYGHRGDEMLGEDSDAGTGFGVEVCCESERLGRQIEALGVRYVAIRTGLVLGAGGGALEKLMAPFRFFLGGYPGSGRQWLSWISIEDQVKAIEFLIKNEQLSGPFNLTAPNPVTMRQFARTLGSVLRRPAWVAVPGFVMRLLVGEMADELLLNGQRVLPNRLLEAGFEFAYEDLERTLVSLLKQDKK